MNEFGTGRREDDAPEGIEEQPEAAVPSSSDGAEARPRPPAAGEATALPDAAEGGETQEIAAPAAPPEDVTAAEAGWLASDDPSFGSADTAVPGHDSLPLAPAPGPEEAGGADATEAWAAPRDDAEPGAAVAPAEGDDPDATATWRPPVDAAPGAPFASQPSAWSAAPPPPPAPAPSALPAASADVTPSSRSLRRTLVVVLAAVLAIMLLGAAGVAYATYNYSQDHDGRILPGARIAGVDVGGLDREAAIAKVRDEVRPELVRRFTVTAGDGTWTATLRKLGARSNARALVDEALAASEQASFADKARMRVLGEGLDFERDVAIRYPRRGLKGFVAGIASSFDREARDASVDYSSGWVEIVEQRIGRKVQVAATVAAMRDAFESGEQSVEASVRPIEPEVTTDAFRQVLLLHIGENKLYLYEDGKIVREWVVATGSPDYMTPTGLYHVTEKRYMPTWVNPSPDGWGASMPASIPPGPSNPLGLRAINWSAPAIRFHGTSATYSLGYNASHGCVRMSNEDAIELYDRIEVGTPIVSVVFGSLRPLGSAPPSGPIAEQSADSAADAEAVETEREPAGAED